MDLMSLHLQQYDIGAHSGPVFGVGFHPPQTGTSQNSEPNDLVAIKKSNFAPDK